MVDDGFDDWLVEVWSRAITASALRRLCMDGACSESHGQRGDTADWHVVRMPDYLTRRPARAASGYRAQGDACRLRYCDELGSRILALPRVVSFRPQELRSEITLARCVRSPHSAPMHGAHSRQPASRISGKPRWDRWLACRPVPQPDTSLPGDCLGELGNQLYRVESSPGRNVPVDTDILRGANR